MVCVCDMCLCVCVYDVCSMYAIFVCISIVCLLTMIHVGPKCVDNDN